MLTDGDWILTPFYDRDGGWVRVSGEAAQARVALWPPRPPPTRPSRPTAPRSDPADPLAPKDSTAPAGLGSQAGAQGVTSLQPVPRTTRSVLVRHPHSNLGHRAEALWLVTPAAQPKPRFRPQHVFPGCPVCLLAQQRH